MADKKLEYFTDVWNYFDLIPPIMLLVFLPLAYFGIFNTVDGVR